MPTQTVLNYLDALTNAYYLHRVQRADINGMKIFEVGDKFYFEDLGLRNAIRSFEYRNDVNKLMENIVYLHIRRKSYNVFVGKLGNKEIDFMAELNGDRIYFQVTYMLFDKKTVDREFGNLMPIDDHYPKFVISMDEVSPGSGFKGVKQIHLRDFLSEQ